MVSTHNTAMTAARAVSRLHRMRRRRMATRALGWAWISTVISRSASVVDAARRALEEDVGEDRDDDEEDPPHRRGVAHAVVLEGVLVQIDRVHGGRFGRPALGHDERLQE